MLFVFEGVVVVVPGFKFVFCPGDERFCVVVLGGAWLSLYKAGCLLGTRRGKRAGGVFPAIASFLQGAKWISAWEVDEHKQKSEKVRSNRFCLPLLDKNRNYEGIK